MAAVLLDLSLYEFVNVLVRKLGDGENEAAYRVALLCDLGFPLLRVDQDVARQPARSPPLAQGCPGTTQHSSQAQ